MNPIPYGRQHITQDDIDSVVNVLKSDYLTQGPSIIEFEEKFAKYLNTKYAVAVSNGTAALHLSVMALDLQPGDKVITTPITFAASANCIRYCGGEVVFSDIDPLTYCLDYKKVEKLIEESPKNTFKGIVVVDFGGFPVNMEQFRELADKHGLWIIEDACHAPGAFFNDSKGDVQYCGNGKYADISVFSFHPVKHIACGEGGMITTNNLKIYNKLILFRTHGITKDPVLMTENHGGWYYEMQELGFNYRLTDFQAALGSSQLAKLDKSLERRREIASIYNKAFTDCDFILGHSAYHVEHAYHLYIIEIKNRKGLYDYLRSKNIFTQVHYIPVHLMPYYRQFGWNEGVLPNAEKYYNNCLSLPMFPTLTEDELNFVIENILEYLK